MRQTSKRTVAKARVLRRAMSLPEVLLWRELKQADLKFRRQHPVGPFVIDFYCPKAKLGIEIDGATHDTEERIRRDAVRDAAIESKGVTVIRIPAAEVLRSPSDTAHSIYARCRGDWL